MKRLIFGLLVVIVSLNATAQTADDQFKKPLKEVLVQIEKQYGVTLRYPEELVKDKWVTYAEWRFRPDVEKTLTSILATQDISFSKEGEKKYKLQNFQYHLKTVEDGKLQLQYISGLFHDVSGWEQRKAGLKSCILSTLKLTSLPETVF